MKTTPQGLEMGLVVNVDEVLAGDQLALAADPTSTFLQLFDAVDFEETGGFLLIGTETLPYISADLDLDQLTFSPGTHLTGSYQPYDDVRVYPDSRERRAFVQLDLDGEGVNARVPHNLYEKLPLGTRAGVTRERVTLYLDQSEYVIDDRLGAEPVVDGSFIDPSTLPPPELSDGDPPASSPTATVIGGLGALFIRWAAIANNDAVTYQVHLSVTNDFNPGPTTLLATTPGTSLSTRVMPDGSPLAYLQPDGITPQVYYAKIIATDADGAGPLGAQGSGSMVQVTSPDVAANYVYAGTVIANQIMGGSIVSDVLVSSALRTANSGQRVEMSSQGITLVAPDNTTVLVSLPTDPRLPATFKGKAELDRATVNAITVRGTTNELSKDARLTLAGKQTNPNPPTVSLSWDMVPTWLTTQGSQLHGLTWYPAKSCWVTAGYTPSPAGFGAPTLYFFANDGTFVGNLALPPTPAVGSFHPYGGVVYHAGTDSFFMLVKGRPFGAPGSDEYEVRKYKLAAPTDVTSPATLVASSQARSLYYPIRGIPTIGLTSAGAPVLLFTDIISGNIKRFAIDTTTCVVASSSNATITPATTATPDLAYYQDGNFDFGTARVMLAYQNADPNFYGYTSSGTTRVSDNDFPMANQTPNAIGAWFGGPDSRFHQLDDSGRLWSYTGIRWTSADSPTWWAGMTWYDADAAGTGTHESGLGAVTSVTMLKRANLVLSSVTIPDNGGTDDPDSARFYLGRGAAQPTEATMWRNATPAPGVSTVTISTVAFSGTSAPTVNNFPSLGAAKITDSLGNTLLDANGFSMMAPTACIQMYAGAAAPTGWLLCQGQAVSRTLFPALFAAIGTTFGVGDGTTTFNVPNMVGRSPIGLNAGDTDFNALGKLAGEKAHALAGSEMPAHTHLQTIGYDGGAVYVRRYDFASSSGVVTTTRGVISTAAGSGSARQEYTDPAAVSANGAAHNVVHPVTTLNFIIKT